MAKCLSDIKTDLTREIATKLAREGATIEGEMGYFPNPKKADKAIGKINAEYRELVVQQGEQGNFSILPSDRLAEYYLDEYNRMKEIERAKGLDEMNFRPEGFYMGDQALEDQEKKDLFFQTTAGKQFTDAMRESLLTFLKGLNISVEFNADELLNSTSFRNNPLAGLTCCRSLWLLLLDRKSFCQDRWQQLPTHSWEKSLRCPRPCGII